MSNMTLDRLYMNVPPAEKEQLLHFRATHPVKHLTVAGVEWEFIACGRGAEALLTLPGLLGIGEMSFQHILAFETEYRVVIPSYPAGITAIAQLLEGIVSILATEEIDQAHVLGGSYGGMVAQRLVRHYPDKVSNLILSHTGGPRPERAKKNRQFLIVLRWLPLGLLRALLRWTAHKSLEGAPAQRAFWQAYSNEMIARLDKADLISRYQIAIDFDATSAFTHNDLKEWPGRILILEGDDDPIAEAPMREALKAFHPQAEVHTFYGTGHVASIAKVDEYVSVIKDFLRKGDAYGAT